MRGGYLSFSNSCHNERNVERGNLGPRLLHRLKQIVPFNVDLIYLNEGRLPVLTSNSRHSCFHSVIENEINVERRNFISQKIGIWLNIKRQILNIHFILLVSCTFLALHWANLQSKIACGVDKFLEMIIFISRQIIVFKQMKWKTSYYVVWAFSDSLKMSPAAKFDPACFRSNQKATCQMKCRCIAKVHTFFLLQNLNRNAISQPMYLILLFKLYFPEQLLIAKYWRLNPSVQYML